MLDIFSSSCEYSGEESVYVTSPEDTILAKLEWYSMGGQVSDQQWRAS
jgi:hypothetical protein